MSNRLTQIALDFGPEHAAPPPPSGVETESASQPPVRQYIEAAGVVVRIKSYKNTPLPNKEIPVPGTMLAPLPVASPVAPPVMNLPDAEAENQLPLFVNSAAVQTEVEVTAEAEMTAEAEVIAEAEVTADPEVIAEAVAAEPVIETPAPQRIEKRRPAAKPAAPKTGPSKRGRKSLKQVAAEADLIEVPTDEVLFSKQYYTMGEVSEMFRVNQSLLRFWETEFDILQPRKNKKGDRYFRPVDIKNLHLIYHLLRQKKYTIEGAKEFLKKNKKADERFEVIQRLQEIRTFLLEWKAQL